MNAAIAKARETLPHFWQVFEKHGRGESDFALKVKITDKSIYHKNLMPVTYVIGDMVGDLPRPGDLAHSRRGCVTAHQPHGRAGNLLHGMPLPGQITDRDHLGPERNRQFDAAFDNGWHAMASGIIVRRWTVGCLI